MGNRKSGTESGGRRIGIRMCVDMKRLNLECHDEQLPRYVDRLEQIASEEEREEYMEGSSLEDGVE